jgi:RHS repeat-associated protein
MRTAIDPGGARSTMAYWADGMRRFLEVGGTRTTFVWDGSDYLQSRTPSDVTTFSTVDAQILDSETGGSESLLIPDPLGSVVKVLDASGNQVYDAAYWPYGEERNSVGVKDTSWGYAGTWGYHFDTSRRLYDRARVLDPVTARWYSVDPLWPNQMAFGYAGLDPVQFFDYLGLSPCGPPDCATLTCTSPRKLIQLRCPNGEEDCTCCAGGSDNFMCIGKMGKKRGEHIIVKCPDAAPGGGGTGGGGGGKPKPDLVDWSLCIACAAAKCPGCSIQQPLKCILCFDVCEPCKGLLRKFSWNIGSFNIAPVPTGRGIGLWLGISVRF